MKSVMKICIAKFGNPLISGGRKYIRPTKTHKTNRAANLWFRNEAKTKNVFFELSKIADNEPSKMGAYVEFGIPIANGHISNSPPNIRPTPLKTFTIIKTIKAGIIR